jgi:hypothetical protein
MSVCLWRDEPIVKRQRIQTMRNRETLSIREFGLGTGNAVCLCEQGCAYEASKLATIKSGLRRVLPEISQHALNESMNADRLLPIYSGNETTISRETFLASLNRLDVFHRAVLLLRLYGGYRAQEVSLLLRLLRNTIQQGMIHALLALVSSLTGSDADDLDVKDILPAAQPTQNMGRNHNSQTHPAAAATCARSH